MNPISAINQAAGKCQSMDGMPSGTKATDVLIHIAELHKLGDDALQFALAKYNRDLDAIARSSAYLKRRAKDIADRERWSYKSEDTLNNAAALALYQHIDPVRLGHTCLKCNGTGGQVGSSCQSCSGSGYKARPDVLYASILGVSDVSYRKTWKERVSLIYNSASQWDDDLWIEWNRRI